MRKYMTFDAEAFLKDSHKWEKEKKEIYEEMDSMAELQRSGDSNGEKSGRIGDSTATAVIQRERLQSKIDTLNMYQKALNEAWEHLSDEQRLVLTAFFFEKGAMHHRVQKCAKTLAVCTNEVYKHRREALRYIAELITDQYNL